MLPTVIEKFEQIGLLQFSVKARDFEAVRTRVLMWPKIGRNPTFLRYNYSNCNKEPLTADTETSIGCLELKPNFSTQTVQNYA